MAEMNKEFQGLYENLKNTLGGDEEPLRANLEAALRPMYEQSRAQLEEQRRANNAAIDVDAYSRGMGDSTWVTDSKLQQLRGLNNSLASLEANYNNQLFTQLQNALQDRDNTAWTRAMQMYQLNHSGGGSGSAKQPEVQIQGTQGNADPLNLRGFVYEAYLRAKKEADRIKNAVLNPSPYSSTRPNVGGGSSKNNFVRE